MANRSHASLRLAGIVGWPVSHSLSPLIHAEWARREGIAVRYDAFAVEPDEASFRRAIDDLRAKGYRGVNVTLPHKEHAIRYAAQASEEARAAGAANMLSFDGAAVLAENSDVAGLAAALGAINGATLSALILGAGGAARGVAIALSRRCRVRRIAVANRGMARAKEVAALVDGVAVRWDDRNDALAGVDIIVNATSLGMKDSPALQLAVDRISPDAIVCDIVYAPLETPLLKAAKAQGCMIVDGLSMLMHQAVPGYLAWLGTTAVVDADLRARLEAALKARGE